MMRIAKTLAFVCSAGSVYIVSNAAQAERRIVAPPAITIEERSRSDGTTYYLMHITLPVDIATIRHAWLELRVDATSERVDGFADPAPLFEAYELRQPLSGDPSHDLFEPTPVPMSRPIAIGMDRIAKIDVTEFARRVIATPTRNYGIVVGSVTTASRGTFEIGSGTTDLKMIIIE